MFIILTSLIYKKKNSAINYHTVYVRNKNKIITSSNIMSHSRSCIIRKFLQLYKV